MAVPFTLLPFYPFTLLPFYPFTLLPFYPFTGPPYQPFLSWAQANSDSFQSPLGLHIHHQHGLWHEYRFGFILDLNEPTKSKLITNPLTKDDSTKGHFSQSKPIDHPCKSCIQACMQACPVGAFSFNNYDVVACHIYVQKKLKFLALKMGVRSV